MNRSFLRNALIFILSISFFLLILRIRDTTSPRDYIPDSFNPIHHGYEPEINDKNKATQETQNEESNPDIPWVEKPSNWGKCLNYTKKYAENNLPWEPIPYPQEDVASVRGCVVILIGSDSRYQNDFQRGIKSFDKYFNNMFHYPIIAFHFNLPLESQKLIRESTNSSITFFNITRPLPTDPSSHMNPTPIGDVSSPPYSFPLEYRFQTYFFMETIFQHEAVKDYNYILRIDNDFDLKTPINYDPFKFMEKNGIVFAFHHWSMDPIEICGGIYGPTYLYQKEMGKYIDTKKDRDLPTKCFCGGGALFTAYAPFFRSPQFKAYWEYMKCLGGVWRNRWAEQNFFPMALSLIADEPERRISLLSNIASFHGVDLIQPHKSWGIPTWPTLPSEGNTDIVNTAFVLPKHFLRGCIVYFVENWEIENLRRSLANLQYHYLWQYSYPVFIFHQNLNEENEKRIATALDTNYQKLRFVKVDMNKKKFFLYGMFEQTVLDSYGYFLRLDCSTNIVAQIHWDIFRWMEFNNFTLAYNRWHSPINELEPSSNLQLWDIVSEIYPELATRLPPKDFYYSLEYFVMGNMDFFRSKNYLTLAKKIPDSTLSSHVFPISISLFQDEPWRYIGDLTQLMINWNTTSNDPFFHKAWWNLEEPIPTWGFKFNNRDPPL